MIIPDQQPSSTLVDGIRVKRLKGMLPYSFLRIFSVILGITDVNSLYLYDPSFLLRSLETISQCNVIQIDCPVPAGAFVAFALTKIFRKTVVVDSHDAFQSMRIVNLKPLRRILEVFLEKVSYKSARIVLAVSDTEKQLIATCGVRPNAIAVIPNGAIVDDFRHTGDALNVKKHYELDKFQFVGFVGNMEYPPNEEAVEIIAAKLAPTIIRKAPNTRFLLIGRKPRKLPDNPSIEFSGPVQNLAQALRAIDVAIAPLLHGSGTRLKILEYFSYGLPVVSTTKGAEGLDVESGVNILIEDEMDAFAASVVRLLSDKELSSKLGEKARQLIVDKYDWNKIAQKLFDVYQSLLTNRKEGGITTLSYPSSCRIFFRTN
jgi:glycosyltransferase involved in cell wall biosynthesis